MYMCSIQMVSHFLATFDSPVPTGWEREGKILEIYQKKTFYPVQPVYSKCGRFNASHPTFVASLPVAGCIMPSIGVQSRGGGDGPSPPPLHSAFLLRIYQIMFFSIFAPPPA